MQPALVDILRCPATHQPLELRITEELHGDIATGELVTPDGVHRYPIENHIPRFVSSHNYAKGFGFQWNKFPRTQLDSYTGIPISRERFFQSSGWTPSMLTGKLVLDIGCGAGRFTEIALDAGAYVVALDYSSAVDACWANHGSNPHLNVTQGDIYHLPFAPSSFDFVYCFGVLQHTPNVKESFMAIPQQLAPGGRLVVDVYPDLRTNILWPKYWLRPITKRMPQALLFRIVELMVAHLFPISIAIGRIPKLGHKLRSAIPIANYEGFFPLSESHLKEWAVLDTFDWLAPRYDQPQTMSTLRTWIEEAGLEDIEVFHRVTYVGRGMKPCAPSSESRRLA